MNNSNVPMVWAGVLGIAMAQAAWAGTLMTTTVEGTIDEPATVTVNGVPAAVSGSGALSTFTAPGVPLEFGWNTLTAAATDPSGNRAERSITVRVDAPFTIQGTVNEPVQTLTVNGKPATVTGGTWTAPVPLEQGLNTLTAMATDLSNNTGQQSIEVYVVRPPIEHP